MINTSVAVHSCPVIHIICMYVYVLVKLETTWCTLIRRKEKKDEMNIYNTLTKLKIIYFILPGILPGNYIGKF